MKTKLLVAIALLLSFERANCLANALFYQQQEETHQEGEEEEGEILLKIKPSVKTAVFNDNDIVYNVNIKSTYKIKQDGKVSYLLRDAFGKTMHTAAKEVKIGPHGGTSLSFKLPPQAAGFYDLSFRFNLDAYDDTVRNVFGVKPEQIIPKLSKPADFNDFWKRTKDSLKKIAPNFTVVEQPSLSTKDIKVYLVQMRSWGNVTIKGWLTIPNKRPKKLPIRYRVPGYLVTMEPSMMEDDFAVLQLNVRGNGNAKDAINTHGIQYNLYNINDKDRYVYRAVYMDCIRGLDFLYSHANLGLDTSRISIDGGSQGGALAIVVAALDKRIKLVTTEVPLYADMHNAYAITKEMFPGKLTPVGYMVNYVKQNRGFTDQRLFRTWDYFDPLNFAPLVKCPVLMGIGLLDELCPPQCSYGLFNKLSTAKKEIWVTPDKGHEVDGNYYRYQAQWLREYFLLP
ncbi:hypothetical protein EOD41_11050 [Mucilaginibacter limnophilus]|uniref:Acetyl xylan esterase domain-containing protein n=1 Tax=Mucilaginibacter limnophilus TaxID=1932778 RepID=A0A3S2Y2P2_9SPHI|nr:acetylxylan esterase [Mucilaginibacter limnophilus]RVU00533.1 hypothetical protein EOD41_11050 [Mucilaginibacter limnophilus]